MVVEIWLRLAGERKADECRAAFRLEIARLMDHEVTNDNRENEGL